VLGVRRADQEVLRLEHLQGGSQEHATGLHVYAFDVRVLRLPRLQRGGRLGALPLGGSANTVIPGNFDCMHWAKASDRSRPLTDDNDPWNSITLPVPPSLSPRN
jgi:hypothetical protein